MKIILLNGPPGCGKDTVSGMLVAALGQAARPMKFADPLKWATAALYDYLLGRSDVDESDLMVAIESRAMKDEPHDGFFGLTPRQAIINVSETLLKPVHGEGFFGKLAAAEIIRQRVAAVTPRAPRLRPEFFVFSDSGFVSEAQVLANHFGEDSIFLVHIHRHGCTFDGDSRSHIYLGGGVPPYLLQNHGTLDELSAKVRLLAQEILEPIDAR